MTDRKYDFSDFDAPDTKSESPQYDFSDFDETPEAAQAPAKSIDDDIERISKDYGVDKDWLKSRQIGMGYYPEEEAKQLLGEGRHGEHLTRAASSSLNSVFGEGLMGGFPTWANKKLGSENEEAAIDALRKAVDSRKSVLESGTEAVLGATPSVAAAKALGLGKWGASALNVGESARAGVMESDQGEELEGAGKGATIAAAFEALPVVGKGIKAAKRLIPGTEDALPVVNKAVARAAKAVPGQSGSIDDIERMLSETAGRRAAKSADMVDEAMQLAPKLDDAKAAVNAGVESRFRDLENVSLAHPDLMADLNAAEDVASKLEGEKLFLEQNERYFGKTSTKLVNDVLDTMYYGGPREAGLSSYKKQIQELQQTHTPEEIGKILRLRALNARRHVDDLMKNKNWDNLLNSEKKAISDIRGVLDDNLKVTFGGSGERLKADRIYSEAKKRTDELFKPLEQLDPNGLRNTSPEKLNNFLKSQSVRGSVFDNRVKEFTSYLSKAEEEIGKIPEAREALAQLEKARELGGMQRLLDNMTRAGGGPTSQAVNAAMQLGTGFATGGSSIPIQVLLYPITNPRGWVEMVDHLGKPLWDAVSKASTAFARTQPTIATRLYLMANQDGETAPPKRPGASDKTDTGAGLDAEIYQKYVKDRQAQDPFTKEVGPGAGLVRDFNSWAFDEIVQPAAKAGYPRAGAALATIPSTVLDIVVPQTAGDYMPMGQAVHVGRKFPFKKWLSKEEGQALRDSITQIGSINGRPGMVAIKGQHELPTHDKFLIVDFEGEAVKPVGRVEISWEKGSPSVEYVENLGKGAKEHYKGAVADFLDKFSQRTGQVTSSMMFEPTNGRMLGQEMWEDRLPRVVEMSDGADNAYYRMLGEKDFAEWQKANQAVPAKVAVGNYPGPAWARIRDTKPIRESVDRVGNISGELAVMARKKNAGPVNPGQPVDVWEIVDHTDRANPKTLNEVRVSWSKGSPVIEDVSDLENVDSVTLAGFLEKLAERFGNITSGPIQKDVTKASAKWAGSEPKWERNEKLWQSLPRVVEIPDSNGTVRYRMLSEQEYGRWLQANPQLWWPKAE